MRRRIEYWFLCACVGDVLYTRSWHGRWQRRRRRKTAPTFAAAAAAAEEWQTSQCFCADTDDVLKLALDSTDMRARSLVCTANIVNEDCATMCGFCWRFRRRYVCHVRQRKSQLLDVEFNSVQSEKFATRSSTVLLWHRKKYWQVLTRFNTSWW